LGKAAFGARPAEAEERSRDTKRILKEFAPASGCNITATKELTMTGDMMHLPDAYAQERAQLLKDQLATQESLFLKMPARSTRSAVLRR
jgi:hypothetical protein